MKFATPYVPYFPVGGGRRGPSLKSRLARACHVRNLLGPKASKHLNLTYKANVRNWIVS